VNQSSLKKYLTKKVMSAAFVSLRRDNVRLTHATRKPYDYLMKSNLKLLLAATVIAAGGTVLVGSTGASASSLAGQPCQYAGSTLTVGYTTFTCTSVNVVTTVKVAGKSVKKTVKALKWNNGVTVVPVTLPSQNYDTTPAGPLIWQESFAQAGSSTVPFFAQNFSGGTTSVATLTNEPVTKYWTWVNGPGFGTGEIENNIPDAATEDAFGNLVITATCTITTGAGCTKSNSAWTSARIWTKDLQDYQYGQIEARIYLPAGPWNWPAFWMMGQNIDSTAATTPWPLCGEIDIAEGLIGNTVEGATIHAAQAGSSSDWGQGNSGLNISAPIPATVANPTPTNYGFTQGFHNYGILWKPNSIAFTLDGKVFATDVYDPKTTDVTQTVLLANGKTNSVTDGPGTLTPNVGGTWPFNKPFFLIFDNAIGGITSPVAPAGTTSLMKVQWIKYYKYQGYGSLVTPPATNA